MRFSIPADVASPENVELRRALRDARDLGSLGETPLVVVSGGPDVEAEVPRPFVKHARHLRLSLHDDYARRSTNSIHVVAEYSGHFVQTNPGQRSSW